LRDELMADISEVFRKNPLCRPVLRLKEGFLSGPLPSSFEWSSGWQHHASTRFVEENFHCCNQ
jgi:mediator of RNA polymerase II transcription subunit 13, fungi type